MNESDLIKKIKSYLKGIDNIFYWKEHGGQYGTAGIPDIIVCYKGKFIALEAKIGYNKPTRLQAATLDAIKRSGGIAEVVYSVDDVKKVIERI